MQLHNLSDLLPFLNFLKKEGIHYNLHHWRDDAIGVDFTLVSKRIECDFFADDFQFSVFSGDESVESDSDLFFALIKEFWGDD